LFCKIPFLFYTILLFNALFWMQLIKFIFDADYRYKVEEKLHLGVREQMVEDQCLRGKRKLHFFC
jgi:hypothetical protein